jgi:hypothetical protein
LHVAQLSLLQGIVEATFDSLTYLDWNLSGRCLLGMHLMYFPSVSALKLMEASSYWHRPHVIVQ